MIIKKIKLLYIGRPKKLVIKSSSATTRMKENVLDLVMLQSYVADDIENKRKVKTNTCVPPKLETSILDFFIQMISDFVLDKGTIP